LKLSIAITGTDPRELWLHARAWQDCGTGAELMICGEGMEEFAQSCGCRHSDCPGDTARSSAVRIVDITWATPGRHELALESLDAGKNVLVATPFAETRDEAAELAVAGRRSNGALMCMDNRLFYPPVVKVLELARKRTVGRLSAVRMRTLVGGAGGWDEYLDPDYPGPRETPPAKAGDGELLREIYEKLSVAVKLLGPIEEIFCFERREMESPVSVVTWKHAAPATYGALDISFAPGLEIRSASYPRDDNMELTGTSGIIWLTKECAQMRVEPTIKVYRGENLFSYGNLDDDWMSGYRSAAGHFAACAAGKLKPAITTEHSSLVTGYAEAAAESARTGQRVRL